MSFQTTFTTALISFTLATTACSKEITQPSGESASILYTMPEQSEPHSATWLQWPHNYGWDRKHTDRYDPIWVAMTKALAPGERVEIVVYNEEEKSRVRSLLTDENIDLDSIGFHIWKTDDVWGRDNGPVFVFNEQNEQLVLNWEFNGWGDKEDYANSNIIPTLTADTLNLPVIDLPVVLEGGAVELDGNGTLMGKLSCITNDNRNPNFSLEEIENYLTTYLGVTNFIWMDGTPGLEITDDHIDGTARFVSDSVIIVNEKDMVEPSEYEIFSNSQNSRGETYNLVELPVTTKKMPGAEWWGLYINYYVGNEVVIVPIYSDPNDAEALRIIGELYPNRSIVGIDVRELYKDGGMLNCVTQQQPAPREVTSVQPHSIRTTGKQVSLVSKGNSLQLSSAVPAGSSVSLFSALGRKIEMTIENGVIPNVSIASGMYLYEISTPLERFVGKINW
jgi:agmatine deiminase